MAYLMHYVEQDYMLMQYSEAVYLCTVTRIQGRLSTIITT